MTINNIPLIVEPEQLKPLLGHPSLLLVDLARQDIYLQLHVPGAISFPYAALIGGIKPAVGLPPPLPNLLETLSSIGITQETHIVAYDEEGGGKAARLLWTLDYLGHRHFSLLNGGITSWANEGFPLESSPNQPVASSFQATLDERKIADKKYIYDHLGDNNVVLLDTRSLEEYRGIRQFSLRSGHIPGAVHLDWLESIDRERNLRFKSPETLFSLLGQRGIIPSKEIIVYCQTHHRASHSYVMLKSLGFNQVRGYAGSWAEWGNAPDTPTET